MPVFVLALKGKAIDGEGVSCTGAQIALVLECLLDAKELSDCAWYAGALDAMNSPAFEPFDKAPTIVGDLGDFLHRLRATIQLLDGVIFAVPTGASPVLAASGVSAEGPRDLNVLNSLVEILAFDTTFIEVVSRGRTLVEHVDRRFGAAAEIREL